MESNPPIYIGGFDFTPFCTPPSSKANLTLHLCGISIHSPRVGRDEKRMEEKMLEFFMPMIPPTATHQMQQVAIQGGKPHFYEPQPVADARAKLTGHLASHVPERPLKGPLQLMVKWCFPIVGPHEDGEPKTSRPDTDNLQKLLKDVMTALRFWEDDAQVCEEYAGKYWAEQPGIYVRVVRLRG